MATERVANKLWNLQVQQRGYNSVSIIQNEKHEEMLLSNKAAELVTIAQASLFACPIGDDLLEFAEQHGTVPTWVGME